MQQVVETILRGSGAAQLAGQFNLVATAAQHVNGLVNTLKGALIGAVGGFSIATVARLGAEFENSQMKIAGFLSALGESGDYTSGLKDADRILQSIQLKSAALPGEAEDYISVFTAALPSVQASMSGTVDQMVDFTNTFSAVGAAFGVDAMQIGNDLRRMLQVGRGGAGLDVRMYTQLLPFMHKVRGMANLTAESFNKMSNVKRMQLLQDTLKTLDPMVKRASGSWDAISGTTATILKTLVRLSTSALFDRLKSSLTRVNALFMDEQGQLTALGKRFEYYGQRAGDALAFILDKGVSGMEALFASADKVPATIKKIETAAMSAARAMLALKAAQAAIGAAKVLAPGLGMGAAAAGSVGLEAVMVPLAALAPIALAAGAAVMVLVDHWYEFKPALEFVGGVLGGALMDLASAGKRLWVAVEPLVTQLGQWVIFATAITALGLGAIIEAIAVGLQHVATAAQWVVDKLKELGVISTQARTKPPPLPVAAQQFDVMLANARLKGRAPLAMAGEPTVGIPKAPAIATPAARGGAKVHQDFRNSRFTIDQKFEEGFDPDRVGVAFADSLQKIGEQKLQSGFEPLFSVY